MVMMQRRVIAVFLAFCIASGLVCVRLYTIVSFTQAAAYTDSHSKKIVLDKLRYGIFDCNSQPLVNEEYAYFAAVKPNAAALETVKDIADETEYENIKEKISAGTPSYCRAQKAFASSENVICLKKYIRYSQNQPAVHLTGYIDGDGSGVAGIEKAFDSYLKTDAELCASFACDAAGRIIQGEPINTDKRYNNSTGGVYLTIDKRIQHIAEDELRASSVKKGAILVCGVSTGRILAMASVPSYDPANVADYLTSGDSPFVNRALSAYPVGSVFKVAVAAAALENGVSEHYSYNCKGHCEVDGTVYRCNNSSSHGTVDMRKALICSCNCYFIELARKIGAKAVYETACRLGFGEQIAFAENMYADAGKMPDPDELKNSGNLANFSFGQGRFTANTLQVANMFSCIGNRGEYTSPYAVTHILDGSGKTVYKYTPRAPVKAIREENAEKIRDMLIDVINEGTAKNAKTRGFDCAGKTATAQTGIFGADHTEKLCTWFGGFFPAEDPEYTIIIIKEDGKTGGSDCAPVFRAVAQRIYEYRSAGS